MKLTAAQQKLFTEATADNNKAGFPFAPTEFWQNETRNFEKEFQDKGIGTILESHYNSRFHGVLKNDSRLYPWFLTTFYSLLKQRDTLGLLDRIDTGVSDADAAARQAEWTKIDHGTPIRVGKRLVYADFLFSVYDFYNLCELCPAVASEPVVIGDLGAGYGRIGHVLVQANPKASYLVLDIPGSLVVSSTTLPALLPHAKVTTYEALRGAHKLNRAALTQGTIGFLGSHDLARIERGSVDVLINVASFQEMPAVQVNAYLEVFNNVIDRGYVYLRNNAYGKFGLAAPNEYRFPARWRGKFARQAAYSEIVFEAGFVLE